MEKDPERYPENYEPLRKYLKDLFYTISNQY
jgi:hypothetical protein